MMKLLTRTRPPKDQSNKTRPKGHPKNATAHATLPAQSASFTNGSTIGKRTTSTLLLICLACAPISLALTLFRPAPKPIAATTTQSDQLSVLQQSAGAYGVGLVGAWLSATRTDPSSLQPYVSTVPTSLGEVPFEYRNLSVASIAPATGTSLVTVTVASDIKTKQSDGKDPIWVRRFFEVNIDTAKNALAAVGLPAPKAGPGLATSMGVGFNNQLSQDSPAAQTIQLMLAAYLTGQGSVDSYLTPGVSIAPVTPAAFTGLSPVSFLSPTAPDKAPADGTVMPVQATVALKTADGQLVTATYFVHLTVRAGRWEVTDLEVSPTPADGAHAPAKPTPTTSPSPTTTEGATP